jgi:hypothetical protein
VLLIEGGNFYSDAPHKDVILCVIVSISVDNFGGSGRCCSAKYNPMYRPLAKNDAVNSILLFSVH